MSTSTRMRASAPAHAAAHTGAYRSAARLYPRSADLLRPVNLSRCVGPLLRLRSPHPAPRVPRTRQRAHRHPGTTARSARRGLHE